MKPALIALAEDARPLAPYFGRVIETPGEVLHSVEIRWERDLTSLDRARVTAVMSVEHEVPVSKVERWKDSYPSLQVVSFGFTGHDRVRLDALAGAGLVVRYAPGYSSRSTAELALTLTLAVLRKLPLADRSVRSGTWDGGRVLPGLELEGLCVGILGTGRIGHASARLFLGLGCSVIGFSRSERAAFTALGASYESDPDEFFERSDVLLVHLPQSPMTDGFVSRDRLKRLRGGVIVNVSRAGVVDNVALARALSTGDLFGAGVDVFEDDPIRGIEAVQNDPLLRLPADACNLVVTPHLGFKTEASLLRLAETVVRNATRPACERDDATLVPSARYPFPAELAGSST